MSGKECPLEEGDRVDHKMFGFGTVFGAPVASVRPNHQARGGVEPAGWIVSIVWDDESRPSSKVAHYALRKLSSPASRPFTYWDRQWKPLLAEWRAARRKVEEVGATFRPLPDPTLMARALAKEASAKDALEAFRRDEAAGLHP